MSSPYFEASPGWAQRPGAVLDMTFRFEKPEIGSKTKRQNIKLGSLPKVTNYECNWVSRDLWIGASFADKIRAARSVDDAANARSASAPS